MLNNSGSKGTNGGDPDAVDLGGLAVGLVSTSAAVSQESDPFIGQILAGRYRLLRALEEGGMARVYEARDLTLEISVAVKLLRPEFLYDRHASGTQLVERFRKEGPRTAKVQHPHVVRVLDSGESGVQGLSETYLFIVMEYLTGEDLHKALKRQGKFPLDLAVTIITQVCQALQAAHAQGVIHRDLKPANIFLARYAREQLVVKVLDFGIAISISPGSPDTRLTKDGSALGTPAYMAPEQIEGLREKVGVVTDVHAAGIILYEMLTGQHPFEKVDDANDTSLLGRHLRVIERIKKQVPQPLAELGLGIPPALSDVVARAMAKAPEERYASMVEFAAALAAIEKPHAPASAAPAVQVTPAPPKLRLRRAIERSASPRRRSAAPLIIAGAAVTVGLVAVFALYNAPNLTAVHAVDQAPTAPAVPATDSLYAGKSRKPATPEKAETYQRPLEPSLQPQAPSPPPPRARARSAQPAADPAQVLRAFDRARAVGAQPKPKEEIAASPAPPASPVASAPLAEAEDDTTSPDEDAAQPSSVASPQTLSGGDTGSSEPAVEVQRKRGVRAGRLEPDEVKTLLKKANADLQARECRAALIGYQKVLQILRDQTGDARYLLARRKSLEARRCVGRAPAQR